MKRFLIATCLFASLCQAANQFPSNEAKPVELQTFRALQSSKRVVDGTGKLVGKDLLIDEKNGQISFTPVPSGPERVYPRLCLDSARCTQPVNPEKLPTLDEILKKYRSTSANECEPSCTETEVCHRCPSPQYPADVCCTVKRTCTSCPGK